ncbi:MAG: DUF3228 family protein [Lysobacter sp.]|nr:DUF3228 family protein [Lysobacter sp.]
MSIALTEFAHPRVFPCESRSNTIQDCTPEAFEHRINAGTPLAVLDGYAPFCKLHAHRGWTSMKMKQRTAIINQARKADRFAECISRRRHAPSLRNLHPDMQRGA